MTAKRKQRGSGIVNGLIDSLPFELHLPGGYQYCGPGTRFVERHNLGQRGISSLDNLCYNHDRVYHNTKDEDIRYNADKQLEWSAWNLVRDKQLPLSERTASWVVMNAMKLKTLKKPSKGSALKSSNNKTKKKKKAANTEDDINGNDIYRQRKPSVKGGFLPALIAALPFLSAVGSLVGGGAAVAKTVIDAKRAQEDLNETRRHNKQMEEEARRKTGQGLYIRPYVAGKKKGEALYIRPYNRKMGQGLTVKMSSKNSPLRSQIAHSRT